MNVSWVYASTPALVATWLEVTCVTAFPDGRGLTVTSVSTQGWKKNKRKENKCVYIYNSRSESLWPGDHFTPTPGSSIIFHGASLQCAKNATKTLWRFLPSSTVTLCYHQSVFCLQNHRYDRYSVFVLQMNVAFLVSPQGTAAVRVCVWMVDVVRWDSWLSCLCLSNLPAVSAYLLTLSSTQYWHYHISHKNGWIKHHLLSMSDIIQE